MTKIRPGRLQEIENEDFSEFASLAYAKGFLLIYGKFLDVDVTPYLEAFETSESVTVDGYSYLQDNPAPAPSRQAVGATAQQRRRRTRVIPSLSHRSRRLGGRIHGHEVDSRAPAPQARALATVIGVVAHRRPLRPRQSSRPALRRSRTRPARHRPSRSHRQPPPTRSPSRRRLRSRPRLNRKCAGPNRCNPQDLPKVKPSLTPPPVRRQFRSPAPRPPQHSSGRAAKPGSSHSAAVDLQIGVQVRPARSRCWRRQSASVQRAVEGRPSRRSA